MTNSMLRGSEAPRPREHPISAEQLRELRQRWHNAPPMTERVLRQWWGNVRMRWNCHSTAIEGSSLSYRDTLDILVYGRTPNSGNTDLLEVDQIRGHDESARMLAAMYNRRHRVDIPDLHAVHRAMLVRPYPAHNALGQPMGDVSLGRFKTRFNAIRTQGGLVEFQPPAAVPLLMPELLERMNQRIDILAQDAQALDPAWALASLHWDFIAIHPYDDGNGRMARWLVNWMCVNTGYPPLVITLEQRDDYFRTLSGMQTGNVPAEEAAVRPLRNFLATCLAESLDFATAVAEGCTDPTWNNADANPQRPDWDANTYPLDATVPWLRAQDQPDDTVLKT